MRQDRIERDARGSAISAITGTRFPLDRHSAEKRFLIATDSLVRWQRQRHWQVIELGFGTGINFLVTMIAWRAQRARLPSRSKLASRLSYTSLVDLPLPASQAALLLAEAGFASSEIDCLVSRWPAPIGGFHRLRLDDGIELTLAYGVPARMLPELTGIADAVYLNASAVSPRQNPEQRPRVDRPVLSALWRLCSPGCRIAGDLMPARVTTELNAAGFAVTQRDNGISGRLTRVAPRTGAPEPATDDHTVAVIGAGIAGLAVARELSHRGWRVSLVEQRQSLLGGGSAQPALAAHQHFSPDDNPLSRLTRAAQQQLANLPGTRRPGRLHLAGDDEHASRQREMIDRLGWPADMLQPLTTSQASDVAGVPLRSGGLWQRDSLLLDPLALRQALPATVTVQTGVSVTRLAREDGRWLVCDKRAAAVVSASRIVICTAAIPPGLFSNKTIATQALFGQSTILSDPRAATLQCILGGDVYACPVGGNNVLTGATYRQLPANRHPGDDAVNRQNWLQLISGTGDAAILSSHSGIRHATSDRLPLIGPMPDDILAREQQHDIHRDDRLPIPSLPGIFLACGFGSRGALWAPLAALIIADQLDGLCLPLEKSLGAAIAPQRFARRAIRHGHLI